MNIMLASVCGIVPHGAPSPPRINSSPAFAEWTAAAIRLTSYARIYRYPGYTSKPSRQQFAQALADAEGLYAFMLLLLPQDIHPDTIDSNL